MLTSKYDKALTRLQKSLVSSDKLDDARAVQEERHRVKKIEVYLSAIAIIKGNVASNNTTTPRPQKESSLLKSKAPADAIKFNDHYYKAFVAPTTWAVAKEKCERLGGHLAAIGDAQEDEFLKRMFHRKDYWFGLYDKGGGKWAWVDGSSVLYNAINRNRNDGGFLRYGIQDGQMNWEPDHNESRYATGYICEWDK